MTGAWPTLAEVEGCEDVETALRWNRFLPLAASSEQVEVIAAVVDRLSVLRARDNGAYVAASKSLGWDR
jgi:hypothetical protein